MSRQQELASAYGAAEGSSEPAQSRSITRDEVYEVTEFLFEEARLADESLYSEWESLVEPDMLYWIPCGQGNFDPKKHVSITYDNRGRLANRIKQLETGKRISQRPPSPMRRVLSNIVVTADATEGYGAACNFVLYEFQVQASHSLQVWPGRFEYRLRRRADGKLGMFYKKVTLVHGEGPVPSLAFIL